MPTVDERYLLTGKPGEIIRYQPVEIKVTEIERCIRAVDHLTDYINRLENRIEELEKKN